MNTKAQHAQVLLEDMTGQRDAARADIEAGLIREDDFTGELNHLSNVVSRYVHIYSTSERYKTEWKRVECVVVLVQD